MVASPWDSSINELLVRMRISDHKALTERTDPPYSRSNLSTDRGEQYTVRGEEEEKGLDWCRSTGQIETTLSAS
ncbi:hypothetical protein ElyMa_004729200 [Elysia marginata]|uniref:Uncharacterized protein n=1 Tax=Elysia marginata TaxID=1093978 RepID=A0AAV4IGQ8_9GAST|nr:hypothetical protein ElyMa_004729200 [Elysia marginata]